MKITIIQIVIIEDDEQEQHERMPNPFPDIFGTLREIDTHRQDKENRKYGPFIPQ